MASEQQAPAASSAELLRAYVLEKEKNLGLLRIASRLRSTLAAVAARNAQLTAEIRALQTQSLSAAVRREPFLQLPPKVFRHRRFVLSLVCPRGWLAQRGLSAEALFRGVLSGTFPLTVRREHDAEIVVTGCTVCRTDSLIIVGATEPSSSSGPVSEPFGPSGDELEQISWDSCQSRCSSSRDHLHTRLFLSLELPGVKPVRSQCFVTQSREKSSSSSSSTQQQQHAATTTATATAEPLQSHALFTNLSIYKTQLQPSDIASMMKCMGVQFGRQPGLVDVQIRMLPGFFAVAVFYRTSKQAQSGHEQMQNWIMNRGGETNPFGCPLTEVGGTTLVAIFDTGDCLIPWRPQHSTHPTSIGAATPRAASFSDSSVKMEEDP